MKYFIVPEDIKLIDLVTRQETEQTYTFFRWLQEWVLMDVRFGASWKTGRTATKISDAFFNQSAGAVIALEDSDYDLLKEAVEEPQHTSKFTGQVFKGYDQPALLQQVGSYIGAVQSAGTRTKKPEEKENVTAMRST